MSTRTHTHTQIMQKMQHSHSRIHSCIFLSGCVFGTNLIYIWAWFTHDDDHYHKIHDPGFTVLAAQFHFFCQFNSSPFFLSSFHFCDCQHGFPLSFILSLTLSLFVFVYVSRFLCEPGAQLRVRSQFPHREGLRDNRGCWQEISLGHAVPHAPLIRFPSKK